MSVIAAIRPDDWNYVLLLHIGGAMILVGGMLTAASALALARGDVECCGSATGRCYSYACPPTC